MYRITIYRNGKMRIYTYATLELARRAAAKIFAETGGVVVGIEKLESTLCA